MPKPSTFDNIVLLVSLRFAGKNVDSRDVAKFLRITDRQARNIINEMVKRGLAKKVHHGIYRVEKVDPRGVDVIINILQFLTQYLDHLQKNLVEVLSLCGVR